MALKRLVAHYVKEPNCKELNLQHKMYPAFCRGSIIKALTKFFRIRYDTAHLYQTFLYFYSVECLLIHTSIATVTTQH